MAEQGGLDFFLHLEKFQGLFENLPPPVELAAHDRVIRMHLAERPAGIFHLGAEKFRRQLIFHFLDASPVGVAEEETDHAVGEDPIDESIDNLSELCLAAQALK